MRIINTLSLFGFAVIMPMMFVDELGFTTSEWLQVWAAFFFTTIFSNVFWGIVAEKMGWMKVIRWFGCIGMALSSLAFYYLPQHFGHNFAMALVPAIALGIFVAARLCRWRRCSRRWSRTIKARRFRSITCQPGCRTFWRRRLPWYCCPISALSAWVIAYTALYILAFFLCPLIRVEQPGFTSDQHAKPFTANAAES